GPRRPPPAHPARHRRNQGRGERRRARGRAGRGARRERRSGSGAQAMIAALGKDLVGLERLSPEQIRLILDTAEPFKEVSERPIKKVPALLDLLTIRDKHGKIAGLKVCLVGDVLHSRVARSNIWGLSKLGAEVGVCGPDTLMPRGIEDLGVCRFRRIEEAIEWADVLNVLRLQLERMEMGFIPSVREYYRVFAVTLERVEKAPRSLTIMHPGPMNRGLEIDSRVAD